MSASSTTMVDTVEIVIMVYHISAIFRELLQVMPARNHKHEYWLVLVFRPLYTIFLELVFKSCQAW
jgi:hypothetical protein